MNFERFIVLGPDGALSQSIQGHLQKRHYTVAKVDTLAQLENLLQGPAYDLIFVELEDTRGLGFQALEALKKHPNPPIPIAITPNISTKHTWEWIAQHAFDYIITPFHLVQLDMAIKKSESVARLKETIRYFSHERGSHPPLCKDTQFIQELHTRAESVARIGGAVLICGEKGTGKSVAAQELYRLSPSVSKPFITINCASLPESLLEGELFGHRNSLLDNSNPRVLSAFELANGGTLLLDEVGAIPKKLWKKLLSILETGQFKQVHDTNTFKPNVRIFATTSHDLSKAVVRGAFDKDLYECLSKHTFNVSPLREQPEDILLLSKHFLEHFASKYRSVNLQFSQGAQRALQNYDWPGNVRELQARIERAALRTHNSDIVSEASLNLPELSSKEQTTCIQEDLYVPSLTSLHEMEKKHILQALERCQGQWKKAADLLEISVRTLRSKVTQYKEDEEGINTYL